jgi:hypothetical protein
VLFGLVWILAIFLIFSYGCVSILQYKKKKGDASVFCIIFLMYVINYKKKRQNEIKCLIWIWANISRKNKIRLYFPLKGKNMFIYIMGFNDWFIKALEFD